MLEELNAEKKEISFNRTKIKLEISVYIASNLVICCVMRF